MSADQPSRTTRPPLPGGVWALGFASLFMDVSSELVHSLLPVFMVGVLGASVLAVGLVEGVAEATALVVKVFSGTLSDALRRRKVLLLIGYGMAAATKPLFPLANSVGTVLLARFLDRVGKGVRGAPRDALVADLVPREQLGRAYGLRQSLDTVGAALGPTLAIALMLALGGDLRAVLWYATIPAVLCVLVLVLGLKEPPRAAGAARGKRPSLSRLGELPAAFWWVAGAGAALMVARFSEAFLVLRALDTGLTASWAPLVAVVMNVVYALLAYPAGALADRVDRVRLLIQGTLVLVVADLVVAASTSAVGALAGVALWGAHMALTQGLLATLVAATAPASLRGTAFGLFNLLAGISALLASLLAGSLWQWLGPAATFLAGAGLGLVSAMLLALAPASIRTTVA